MTSETIIIENSVFSLTLGTDCVAYSLIEKNTDKECLSPSLKLPLFTVTEDRPYNNEIKLTYMNKRTEFAANSVERNGDVLTVGEEVDAKITAIDNEKQKISLSIRALLENEQADEE